MTPINFKLFNKNWTIRKSYNQELTDAMGMCYPDRQEIAIDTAYPASQVKHVIVHELVHAIEMTLDLEMTERQVDLMALGMIDLLMNNPQLQQYFTREADQVKPRVTLKQVLRKE